MIHDVYSVFGNKVRAKLILCLARGAKNVTELIQTCGLSQSAVSQHLGKLKKSRVVKTMKDGKEVYYSLRSQKAAEVSRLLAQLEKEVV